MQQAARTEGIFPGQDGNFLWSFNSGDAVRSVAISRDGDYVATGSANNYVYLLDSEEKPSGEKTGSLINSVTMTLMLTMWLQEGPIITFIFLTVGNFHGCIIPVTGSAVFL